MTTMTAPIQRNISNDSDIDAMDEDSHRGRSVAKVTTTPSWGNFQFAKRLSLVTPKYDVSDDEEGEDMFSVFTWSNTVCKDQFSKGTESSVQNHKTNVPPSATNSAEVVASLLAKAEAVTCRASAMTEGGSSHRRARRRTSIGESKPYSASLSDDDGGGHHGRHRERYARSRSKDSNPFSECLSLDDNAAENVTSYFRAEKPRQPHRRAERRGSMPSMPTYLKEKPEKPRHSENSSKLRKSMTGSTEMPSSRSSRRVKEALSNNRSETESNDDEPHPPTRTKVRDSMSRMTSGNVLPKPRPLDWDLVPPALSLGHINQQDLEESPRRSGRALRRGSMPLQSSYKEMPKPRPLDPTLFPIVMAAHDSSEDPHSGRVKRRESMPTGYCGNSAGVPGPRPDMPRQRAIRRKSNDDSVWQLDDHPSDMPAAGSDSLRARRRGSPQHTEAECDVLATRTEPLRTGRMSRRSSM